MSAKEIVPKRRIGGGFRATHLPGVWGRLKFPPNTLRPRSAGSRPNRRDSTNAIPGMRAVQRARATGGPVNHRGPCAKAKRRREAARFEREVAS